MVADRLSNAFPIDGVVVNGKSLIVHYQWSNAPKGIEIIVINNLDQAEHLITGQFRVVTSRGIDHYANYYCLQNTWSEMRPFLALFKTP